MPLLETPPGPIVKIDGREYLYFVGTGYLGLQGHPEVICAACEAAEQYGIGSANSRTAFGTTPPVLQVERAAAEMFALDEAFYFASGWMGNNILVQSLGVEFGAIFIDEHSHYSLFEAAKLAAYYECRPGVRTGEKRGTGTSPNADSSEFVCVGSEPVPFFSLPRSVQSTICPFRHRDADDLRAKLKEQLKAGESPLVLSDGVFAATGKVAPVDEYQEILRAYPGSMLILDDAHGLGVLGANGRGTYEHLGLWDGINSIGEGYGIRNFAPSCPALLFSSTLSKAIGGFGGIIPGSRDFIHRVKTQSPYFGGASAPPGPIAAATARALELVAADPGMRAQLWTNVHILKAGLGCMGFDVDDSPVPVVCLTIGAAENMQRIQRELMARGIAVAYMASYSGLGPEGGLRIAVFATHTEAMIGRLLDELRRVV